MEQLIYILKFLVLGFVEGVTEFLPISSTGHLIIAERLLGLSEQDPLVYVFSILVQFAAILAIVVLYWSLLKQKTLSFFKGEKSGRHFAFICLLGLIPAGLLGFVLDDFIEEKLFSLPVVCVSLFVGAIFLLILEQVWIKRQQKEGLDEISGKDAVVVGLWQCLALCPGFSRSAATIMGGWNRGMKTKLIAEYSFFLAIPLMFAASFLKLVKFSWGSLALYQILALVLGSLVAFSSALMVVRAFLTYLKKKPFRVFAYYRIGLALLMLVLLLTGVL